MFSFFFFFFFFFFLEGGRKERIGRATRHKMYLRLLSGFVNSEKKSMKKTRSCAKKVEDVLVGWWVIQSIWVVARHSCLAPSLPVDC
ncbi:MAG: hypothetical protein J3R72DRAFT_168421 [Linnemannia gamsii]|nr:MAG: hypothetical protein J3R72DRAFT_168421 [Linnemannia gamsii]